MQDCLEHVTHTPGAYRSVQNSFRMPRIGAQE